MALSLERVVCGVCGTGLLFENYIVDASIFYKKQFPRIYEPGSVLLSLRVVPFAGCGVGDGGISFRGSLEE